VTAAAAAVVAERRCTVGHWRGPPPKRRPTSGGRGQANAGGKYNHPADRQDKPLDPAFRGWGRACSDFKTGVWTFETIKPGSVAGRAGRAMAPHVSLWIVARGINIGLNTRMYFSDEAEANAADPVLNLIEWEVRRNTLIAQREARGGATVYRFDVHLQGPQETVFFDI
jgi:protocatechuate 3,4-dioxygenase alpha subunit